MLPEAPPPPQKSRTPLYLGLGLVLVLALTGAAFLAGRLLNQPAAAGPQVFSGPGNVTGSGEFMLSGSGEGGAALSGGPVSIQIQVTPAPELPQLPPEVTGVFVSREDNRLFIGTGQLTMSVGGPGAAPQSSYDGPQVEVVVTQATRVYRETTQPPDLPPDPAQASTSVIQQTVAPGSVDELSSNTSVIVWGRRTGDRVIADLLLYSQPMIVQAPGP